MSRSGRFLVSEKKVPVLRIQTENCILFLVGPNKAQQEALGEALLAQASLQLDFAKVVDLAWASDLSEALRTCTCAPFFTHAPHAQTTQGESDDSAESAD